MARRANRKWLTYRPDADLMRESVTVTRRMQALHMPTATKTPTKRVAPPGRLITRNAVTAAALRQRGDHRAAMKVERFRANVIDRQPRPPAVVAIMADVSASMSWSTTAVGEAAWLLARGAAHSGARVASVTFGAKVDPIVFPDEIPQDVLVRLATDYDHEPDRALAALDGALGLSLATRNGAPIARVVVVISDLQWGREREPWIQRARALMTSGVRFVVVGPPDKQSPAGADVDIPSDIRAALGVRITCDPRFTDPDDTRRTKVLTDTYADDYYGSGVRMLNPTAKALIAHGAATWVPPTMPMAPNGTEAHAMRAARVDRLTPLEVVTQNIVCPRRWMGGGHGGSDDSTRRLLVDEVLRVMDQMTQV